MAYTPTIWKDGQAPALNAENLNKMEQGIAGAYAALEGKVPMTVLRDETLTESAARITFNPAGEEWGKYSFVLLTYKPAPIVDISVVELNFGTDVEHAYNIYLSSGNFDKRRSFLYESARRSFTLLFFTGSAWFARINALGATENGVVCSQYDGRFDDPSKPLTMSSNGPFPAGTQIKVIGIL